MYYSTSMPVYPYSQFVINFDANFYKIGQEVSGDTMGDEFKGYVFEITGGNDKQGFPMRNGVLVPNRVRLLLKSGPGYRPKRDGERKRKTVRGCIVGLDLSVLSLAVIKQGETDIPGLTDTSVPKKLGPKRANNIRKLFNLSKDDDVRKYVIRRTMVKGDKTYTRAPKIQRLITPERIQRKRNLDDRKKARIEKRKNDAAEYATLLATRVKEEKERRREVRRLSSMRKASVQARAEA